MKKKILIWAGLISVGYILYRKYKRKTRGLSLMHMVEEVITTPTDTKPAKKETVSSYQQRATPEDWDDHNQGVPRVDKWASQYQQRATPEEREHNKGLVQQWLAAHPECHKKSGRKPGTSGKYALRFNRMSVWSIIHYYNVNSNTIDKIRTAAFKFSMRYNVELRVERIDKNACKVTRIS